MIKRESLFSEESVTRSDRWLHTPSIFAKHNLLYVQEVGRLQSLVPHKCIRENLNSFLFLVVLDGKGSLEVEGEKYELGQGDCALIDCLKHYEHVSDEKYAWKLAWVHFDGFSARGYYELFMKYNKYKNVFKTNDFELWNTLIGKLLDAKKEKDYRIELICGEILLQLLNCIIDSVASEFLTENENSKQFASDLRVVLNEHYAERNVLKFVQDSFDEPIQELETKFSTQFGISIEEYVNNRRLNAAKELLRFSIKSIDEIVEESGINDMDTMQQMFMKNEEMTAQEYRAKWAAWIR